MANLAHLLKFAKTKILTQDLDQEITMAFDTGVVNWNNVREKVASGSFNVSKLGRCIRETYYERQVPPTFRPAMLKLFRGGIDTGQRLLHYALHAGQLFGIYVCGACGFRTTEFRNITCCGECGSKELLFPEVGIRDLSLGKGTGGLSGKMDMLFLRSNGKVIVVEVKAASSRYRVAERKNVEAKLRGYIQQGNMYVGLLRRFKRRVESGKEHQIIFYEDLHGEIIDGLILTERMDLTSFALAFEDKNTMENHVHEFIYDHDMYLEDRNRVKVFFECVEQEKLPPKEVSDNCKFCQFKECCDKKRNRI